MPPTKGANVTLKYLACQVIILSTLNKKGARICGIRRWIREKYPGSDNKLKTSVVATFMIYYIESNFHTA